MQKTGFITSKSPKFLKKKIRLSSSETDIRSRSTPLFIRKKNGKVTPAQTVDIVEEILNEPSVKTERKVERRLSSLVSPRRIKSSYRKLVKSENDAQLLSVSKSREIRDDCDILYHDQTVKVKEHYRLRRRASSLDFLPEVISQTSSQQNGGLKSHFARTTSMSQRSPFRKKSQLTDSEITMTGIKEMRPKSAKRPKSGIDCLFDAIERQDIDDVRKLLNILDLDVNELNPDQFSPLDVALMCGETEIAHVLQNNGARENPEFHEPDERLSHLETLIENADKNVNDYSATIVNCVGDAKDNERQLREWEWRLYMLRVMQNGYLNTEKPLVAPCVTVAPLSNQSVVVTLSTTNDTEHKELITKYKVEWSRNEDFFEIEGFECITDQQSFNYTITGLEKNIPWYVRVQSGNIKGFSPYGYPEPKAVIPSSWHECECSLPRWYGVAERLGGLLDKLCLFEKQGFGKSSDENSEEESVIGQTNSTISQTTKQKNRKVKMKAFTRYTSLIFNSAPKLLKKIKGRGIYLAALLYNDDLSRVLVTMDENLPVVECDDIYSKSFSQEFYWFTKTSCTWQDIQHMLYFSTKSHSSQSVQIRRKLLQAALVLMNATGVTNLGPIHYKPFKDNHGSILLLAVNCIKKISSSNTATMKWIPIQKFIKRNSSIQENMVAERLIPSVQEQVTCHRRSRMHLPKGLYLGYLKLRTTVDTLSILVPNSHTNVLPCVKVQDIPNVTKDEWEWLKSLNNKTCDRDKYSCTNAVKTFEKRLKNAANKLFSQLGISSEESLSHRLYDHEVIELNSEVLFILICPPVESICTPPNQIDSFSTLSAYSFLPVQAFEMNNMMTYQPKLMSCYCRLSSILELENFSTQQNVRESICQTESKSLKEKQEKIYGFQNSVDELWRTSRWVVDTLQTCQERNLNCGIPLSALFHMETRVSVDSLLSVSSMNSSTGECCDNTEELNSTIDHHGQEMSDLSESLRVYGTTEVLSIDDIFVEVTITHESNARDVINESAELFRSLCFDYEGSSTEALATDKLDRLCLVVLSGSRERCLRDELKLSTLQTPWKKGAVYLRLKKEALKATKWGLSTPV